MSSTTWVQIAKVVTAWTRTGAILGSTTPAVVIVTPVVPPSGSITNGYLLENGTDLFLLEDGASYFLQEA